MGAFGPKRVVTSDDTHTPAAPYQLVNNDYSLLDASDVVFIDAPGAGFSRLIANDEDKRSEEHTSELQSLMRISYAVFCLKKKNKKKTIKSKQYILQSTK